MTILVLSSCLDVFQHPFQGIIEDAGNGVYKVFSPFGCEKLPFTPHIATGLRLSVPCIASPLTWYASLIPSYYLCSPYHGQRRRVSHKSQPPFTCKPFYSSAMARPFLHCDRFCHQRWMCQLVPSVSSIRWHILHQCQYYRFFGQVCIFQISISDSIS